jgi:hypothetical protein
MPGSGQPASLSESGRRPRAAPLLAADLGALGCDVPGPGGIGPPGLGGAAALVFCQTRRSTATTLPANFALPPGIGV